MARRTGNADLPLPGGRVAAFIERAGCAYAAYSATPKERAALVDQHISKMWAEQPNWSDAQLRAIDTPMLLADGDHDEAIKREHTESIAAITPHAGLPPLYPSKQTFSDSDVRPRFRGCIKQLLQTGSPEALPFQNES
jgi:hypothetical protein